MVRAGGAADVLLDEGRASQALDLPGDPSGWRRRSGRPCGFRAQIGIWAVCVGMAIITLTGSTNVGVTSEEHAPGEHSRFGVQLSRGPSSPDGNALSLFWSCFGDDATPDGTVEGPLRFPAVLSDRSNVEALFPMAEASVPLSSGSLGSAALFSAISRASPKRASEPRTQRGEMGRPEGSSGLLAVPGSTLVAGGWLVVSRRVRWYSRNSRAGVGTWTTHTPPEGPSPHQHNPPTATTPRPGPPSSRLGQSRECPWSVRERLLPVYDAVWPTRRSSWSTTWWPWPTPSPGTWPSQPATATWRWLSLTSSGDETSTGSRSGRGRAGRRAG